MREAPEPQPALLTGRTVLVVDDQALNRAIASMTLTELGIRVLEAEHGQQALDMLRAGAAPDAILMDVNMPGMSGLETTRAIRSSGSATAQIPVLAVTGNTSAALAEAAQAAGLQGVLAKPIDAARLAAELGRVLSAAPDARAAALSGAKLLDLPRIDGFGRVGLLHDLLPEALAEMRRLAGQLKAQVAAGDTAGVEHSLHTLLGISGEAGAQALYECTRRHYESVLASRAPQGDWLTELESLAIATEAAMNAHCGLGQRAHAVGVP